MERIKTALRATGIWSKSVCNNIAVFKGYAQETDFSGWHAILPTYGIVFLGATVDQAIAYIQSWEHRKLISAKANDGPGEVTAPLAKQATSPISPIDQTIINIIRRDRQMKAFAENIHTTPYNPISYARNLEAFFKQNIWTFRNLQAVANAALDNANWPAILAFFKKGAILKVEERLEAELEAQLW